MTDKEKVESLCDEIVSAINSTFDSHYMQVDNLITAMQIAVTTDDEEARETAISVILYTIFGAIRHSQG